MLAFELTETFVQVIQSHWSCPMLAAPFTFQTRCARIVVPLLVSRRCERGSWLEWEFLLSGFRRWGTVAKGQRGFPAR